MRALTWGMLMVLALPALADTECSGLWRQIRGRFPVIQKSVSRDWDAESYQTHRAQWDWVEPDYAPRAFREALARGRFDTPEKLFAALDSLEPQSEHTFLHQMEVLRSMDVHLRFRRYRMPYGWAARRGGESGQVAPREPGLRVKKGWPRLHRHWKFLGRRRHATVRFPDRAPRTPQQLMDLAYQYAVHLSLYRIYRVTEHAPVFSLPAGPEAVSYPKQALRHLREAEAHLFRTLHHLQRLFPDTRLPLPEKDRLWKRHYVQLTWEFTSRILFPSYAPLGPYRPTLERYARHLNRETQPTDAKYGRRLALHWTVSRWREVFLGVILLHVWDTLAALPHTLDRIEDLRDEIDEMEEKYSPQNLNRAMDNYHGDGAGFDPVLEHYNAQINALRGKIRTEGDPAGEIAEQIRELEERRDFLAY